jgi:hypothetical protein
MDDETGKKITYYLDLLLSSPFNGTVKETFNNN